LVFSARETWDPRGESESVACECRRGDVVARDDVIECKSLRYTVIEHFSHFPSRASVTSLARSLARSLAHSLALLYSRRIKIEANIIAVVLPPARPHAHSRRKARAYASFATWSRPRIGTDRSHADVYAKTYARVRACKTIRRAREDQVRPRLRTVMGAWVIKWGPLLSPGGGAPSITHIVPPIPSFFPPTFVPRAAAPGRIYSDRPGEFCPGSSRQREILSNLSVGDPRARNFSKMMVVRRGIFANFRYSARLPGPRTCLRKGFSRENREVERADNTFAAAYIHDHIPPLVSPHPPNNSGVVQSRRRTDGNPGV